MSEIASYLESMGAKPSAGSEWVMGCPFCDRKGHLYCNTEEGEDWDGKKKPAGRWICFGCQQKSLNFATLLAELEGVSFSEARATMGKWKLGGIRLKRPIEQVYKEVSPEEWLPPEYEPCTAVWPKYLTTREVSLETAKAFKLGVCRSGKFAHRIILPIDCPAGRSFQARAILPDTEPRYLSGDNSGQLLFGWHTIEDAKVAVICEGPFDTIKVVQSGLPSVALMGKELRDSQRAMLKHRRRAYVIALDPMNKDKLAIDSACKIAEELDGKVVTSLVADPGASTTAQIIRAVHEAVQPLEARKMVARIRLAELQDRTRNGRDQKGPW